MLQRSSRYLLTVHSWVCLEPFFGNIESLLRTCFSIYPQHGLCVLKDEKSETGHQSHPITTPQPFHISSSANADKLTPQRLTTIENVCDLLPECWKSKVLRHDWLWKGIAFLRGICRDVGLHLCACASATEWGILVNKFTPDWVALLRNQRTVRTSCAACTNCWVSQGPLKPKRSKNRW